MAALLFMLSDLILQADARDAKYAAYQGISQADKDSWAT